MKIDKRKFIQIDKGLWYEKKTGLPWSTKYSKSVAPKGYFKWFYDGILKRINCIDKAGYHHVTNNGITTSWYKLVFEYFNGKQDYTNNVIDHKDNNKLNCRIDNLHLVSYMKNSQKRKMQSNNTSGYTGVYYVKSVNRYRTSIGVNSKIINLGYYDSAEEAYQVFLKAKIKYHGKDSIKPLRS
jgi:hypothetical protein